MHFWKMKALSYLSGIYVYRWYALAVAWLFCIAGWSTVAVMPDSYRASAKVYIDTQSIMDPLLRGLTVSLDSQQEIAIMLTTLITRPTIEQVIHLINPKANQLTAAELEQEVGHLQGSISISQLDAKNYYELSYVDKDATTATNVAQALLSILQNNRVGNTRLNMDDARSFINKEIADYENRLREADKRRQDFRTANLDILDKPNAGNRIDAASAAYDQATRDYNAALARHNNIKAQLDLTPKTIPADGRMFLGPNGGGPIATTDTSAQRAANYLQRLQQAEASLDDLRTKYTDNHPEVIATKKLITQLQAEISSAPKANNANADPVMIPNPILVQLQAKYSDEEANLAVQRQRLDATARDLESAKREATKAIDTQTRFNQLDRDYGNVEGTYKQLLQSKETAALSQARDDQNEGISFRVLDPPQIPHFPSSPNRRVLNTTVLLMGLGSGAAVAVLLMLNASRLITVEDVVTLFAVPVLGVVTRLKDTSRTQLGWATVSAVVCAVLLLVTYGGVLAFLKTTIHPVSYGAFLASFKNSIHAIIGASSV
jgi:polysaccharide chain length determinant protein (PEP-CTERM system associated)